MPWNKKRLLGYLLVLSGAALVFLRMGFGLDKILPTKTMFVKEVQMTINADGGQRPVLQSSNCPIVETEPTPERPLAFKGMHPLSSAPPYGCRLQEIQRRCAERNIKAGSLQSDRFKYGVNMPLVLCELPKVASTTWQAVLMKLNGFQGEVTKELIHKYSYERFPHKTFGRLSEFEARKMLADYTTFMITRHPFERLVSAFFNKFTNRSDMTWYRRNVGIPMAKKQAADFLHGISIPVATGGLEALKSSPQFLKLNEHEQDGVMRYRHVLQTGEVSFQQFIRQVLTYERGKNENKMDVHWRPQVLLCQPCSFTYSMVMRFENLVDESNRLLEFVQRDRNTNITFPGESKPFTQSKTTVDALQLISEADVNRLRDLYADDFYVLGHDPYRYSGRK